VEPFDQEIELLVRCLEDERLTYMFAMLREGNLAVLEALVDS
jgi:hypothetical protein